MNARRSRSFVGLVFCFAPVAAWAVDPAYQRLEDLSRELIAVMKLDEQLVQKVESRILARCQDEKCDADLRQCLMKIDREYFRERLEWDARSGLTPDEMAQAITYFRSETGARHLDILRAEQGLGGSQTLFNQDAATRARMLAFLDTRAGYLVITRSVLTTGSASKSVAGKVSMAFWTCKPQRSASQPGVAAEVLAKSQRRVGQGG